VVVVEIGVEVDFLTSPQRPEEKAQTDFDLQTKTSPKAPHLTESRLDKVHTVIQLRGYYLC